MTKEHTITTIRTLLEGDARYASLERVLRANPNDEEAAYKLFIAVKRYGKGEFVVYLATQRHVIFDWQPDGGISTVVRNYTDDGRWLSTRSHNHSSWNDLRTTNFRWEIE